MSARHRSALAVITLLVCAISAVAQQKPFTLEQVMSSPFPSDLSAAPKGGVAWIFNDQGKRNIWVAEPPDFKARQITPYSEDDGQDVGELSWAPDAHSIVYTRGGDLETRRSEPNPGSSPQGVEQDVWMISLAGGAPRKLAEGSSAEVSPKGDNVVFLNHGQIWLVSLQGSEKPAQLIHSNGTARDLRWSPDGSKLAFVSSRDDHSFIGLYDFPRKGLRYLDPGVDHDVEPVWSPDGAHLAFIRMPFSTRDYIFGPHRTGQPWSIRVVDVATGDGHQIWAAQAGDGSVFHAVESEHQLLWGAGDRLVFPWEQTGWLHLYSVGTARGAATELTSGQFEVDHTALSPDCKEVVYSSNQGDTDRRHLWRVAVDGGPPEQLTRGTGLEWTPVVSSEHNTIFLLHSDPQWPARPAMLSSPFSMRDIAESTMPRDFPGASLVTPQQVIISAADGMPIHCQLFLPASGKNGQRYPALVFFHGGSRRQMLLGWHYMDYYHNAYAMNQFLASRGYVVLSVNYRSGIGYGMKFREALNYGADGASEFNDVQGAGVYLRGRPDVDPKRIGVWGGSYGGYLTAMALARASDLFAAGVDFHGVHDWNREIRNWLPSYNPEADPNAARLAWESSPLASIKTWRSPVLLVQGDDDRNVPFAETIHLAEALRAQGVQFQLLVFPDEIHNFLLHRSWLAAYQATSDFFDRKLNPASGEPMRH